LLEDVGDGTHWVVAAPLMWHDPDLDQVFVVPRGFVTDLGSIPRLLWSIYPRDGIYRKAAVIHDWLCARIAQGDVPWSWVFAADVFWRAMRDSGVPPVTARVLWLAVQAYGVWRVSEWKGEMDGTY
jgi:hypothetical protein